MSSLGLGTLHMQMLSLNKVAFTNATSFINLVLSLALFIKGTGSPDDYLLEGLLSILYDHAPLVFTFKSILSCVQPSLDAGNIRLNLHVLVSDYAKLSILLSLRLSGIIISPQIVARSKIFF